MGAGGCVQRHDPLVRDWGPGPIHLPDTRGGAVSPGLFSGSDVQAIEGLVNQGGQVFGVPVPGIGGNHQAHRDACILHPRYEPLLLGQSRVKFTGEQCTPHMSFFQMTKDVRCRKIRCVRAEQDKAAGWYGLAEEGHQGAEAT